MMKCPICGGNVLIMHDNLHGEYDMGWSIGCGRYKANDGIHNRKMSVFGMATKEQALNAWQKIVDDVTTR